MATEAECPHYNNCGFVKWRSELGPSFGSPLPEDGDCGISVNPAFCLRQNTEASTVRVEDFGPATSREFEISGLVKK